MLPSSELPLIAQQPVPSDVSPAATRTEQPLPVHAAAHADFRERITVLLLTFNEAANIARTLDAVRWAKRIVIVDSGSTDATVAIASRYPQVEVVTRAFDSHAAQWSHGLALCRERSEWILALDADYVLSATLSEELRTLAPAAGVKGYRADFVYCIDGAPLRGSLYPPVTVLYRSAGASYIQEGHTHRLVIDGPAEPLSGAILHDDRKPLSHWLGSQMRYARLEAEHILAKPESKLRKVDRLRRLAWVMPLLVVPYTLLFKGCILDGWRGWTYALQRLLAETVLALEILDRRLKRS